MKTLVIDIETKPSTAYVWRMYDEVITPEKLITEGGMICFGAHWIGTTEHMFYSDWQHGHDKTVRAAHRLLSEADAVVTYNGDKFDLPKLRGEFLRLGLKPIPPLASIDLYKTVKKLGFAINKLSYIGPMLGIGAKLKNEGFPLWSKVLDGDPIAQAKMERYCRADVKLTTRLYKTIAPYITNHPYLGTTSPHACANANCKSPKLQSRGTRRTKYFQIQRLQCQSCGQWQDGKREKI